MIADRPFTITPLERFRLGIARNAAGWLAFVRERAADVTALEQEFTNLIKAISQALAEPPANASGLDLVVALWPLIERRGHWLGWEPVLREALALCRRLDRPALEAQLLDHLGDLARTLGDSRRGLAAQKQALAIYRRLGDQAAAGHTLNRLSQQHLALGDYPAAAQCSQEATMLLAQTGNRADLAAAYNDLGLIDQHDGKWESALQHHIEAEALFAALGDLSSQAKAVHNQGEVHRYQRRADQAEACFGRAAAMHVAAGDEINAARSRVTLGIALHGSGETAQALAIHREVEPLFRSLGDRPWLARVLNNQGVFFATLGHANEAALAYEEAADLHLGNADPVMAASSLLNWAELLLDQSRPTDAQERLNQAGELLRSVPAPPAWVMRTYDTLIARTSS